MCQKINSRIPDGNFLDGAILFNPPNICSSATSMSECKAESGYYSELEILDNRNLYTNTRVVNVIQF